MEKQWWIMIFAKDAEFVVKSAQKKLLKWLKRRNKMPNVKIDMWPGKTDEEKENLIKGITKVFEEIDIKKEWVTIVINEIQPKNWGIRGELGSKIAKK